MQIYIEACANIHENTEYKAKNRVYTILTSMKVNIYLYSFILQHNLNSIKLSRDLF